MARVPSVTRESIPENQKASFDEIVQERGEIPSGGPGSVMLNAPEVAKRALGLALFLRTETSLEPRIRELGMLVAARENDCQFIWNAHAPSARRAGLRDDIVDALRDKKGFPTWRQTNPPWWSTEGSSSAPAVSARLASMPLWPSSGSWD